MKKIIILIILIVITTLWFFKRDVDNGGAPRVVRRAAQATERGSKGVPRNAGRPENLRRRV